MKNIFYCQFINTALIPFFIVYKYSNDVIPAKYIQNLVSPIVKSFVTIDTAKEKSYYITDIDRQFYELVGYKYMWFFFLLTFQPLLM